MEPDNSIIEPINIGNPNEFTIIELAEMVIKLTNSKAKIKFMPSVEDDPKMRCPNINLANKLLNWNPTIKLEDGLLQTIEYFDKLIKNS